MAWLFYGDMNALSPYRTYQSPYCQQGPLPMKRWRYGPGERGKKHRFAYRASSKVARVDKSDEAWLATAIEYAKWIAKRDGIDLPAPGTYRKTRADWSGAYSTTRKASNGGFVYERRIRAVQWGDEVERFNTRKDGRRGAFIGKEQVTYFEIVLPNWDWQPAFTQDS